MSYILDALKKADAERERGAVPGLHARQVAPAPAQHNPTRHRSLWLALMGTLVTVGAVALLWPGHAPVAVVAAPPAGATPLTAPSPPAPIVLAPAPAVAVTAPASPLPVAKPETRTPARTPTAAPEPTKAVAAAPTPAAPAAPAPLLSELPVDIRGQIPPLAISGSVYSDNPSQRLLLINGQVLPQGSQVAPNVTLLEIHRGHSEFSFRGARFRVTH